MARKVDYFAMKIPNRAGEAARLLKAMGKAGVNLLAFTGFPAGRGAQIDFVPASTKKFLKVAKKLRLRVGKKKSGFLVHGTDRAGALASVLGRLPAARTNVTAVGGVRAGSRRFGAILWVKRKDVGRATRALHA